MPSIKRKLGDSGEKLAIEFLNNYDYKILSKNYRIKNIGEIDIIAKKNERIVFFEVKTRHIKHISDFPVEYSIDRKKRRNLMKICQIYLSERKLISNTDWQVDAIFVKIDGYGKYNIEHLENILWEEYY